LRIEPQIDILTIRRHHLELAEEHRSLFGGTKQTLGRVDRRIDGKIGQSQVEGYCSAPPLTRPCRRIRLRHASVRIEPRSGLPRRKKTPYRKDAPQLAETEPDRMVTLRSVAYVVPLLKAASDCALGIPGSSVDAPGAPADGYVPIGAVDGENRT
jgi:hypothetical protein